MPPQAPSVPQNAAALSLSALLPLTGLRLEMHGRSCALGSLLVPAQLASVEFDSDTESLISR